MNKPDTTILKCRFCQTPLWHTFVDLGMSPFSNSYLKPESLNRMEPFFPLHAYVCEDCKLVQLGEFQSPAEIFSDYAYFSSYSMGWLEHARKYTEYMIERFGIDTSCKVIEIASNDGYLLKNFHNRNIPVLGIEPAKNVAEVARKAGIPTLSEFFGVKTAQQVASSEGKGDLVLGNNVLAHVPDLNDFVAGLKIVLKPTGVITMEFPHLTRLISENQFDTIYHEHFSYFSLFTVERVFKHQGLSIFDVQELPTHGGSLRIFACHAEDTSKPVSANVQALRDAELRAGIDDISTYRQFDEQVKETKRKILDFLIDAKRQGKKVAAYGAPAKGNTLLNYCGVRTDFIDYTVDASPHKQGLYLPGTHIPIYSPEKIRETKPDYVFILPWNLKVEIMEQMADIRQWGGKFVIPIPEVKIYE